MARLDDLVIDAPIRDTRSVLRWRTLLEGSWYRFRIAYYERDQRWRMDVLTDAGAAVVEGVRMVEGRDLLAPFHHLTVPPGQMFVEDVERLGRSPDRYAWQGFARLYYRPSSVVLLAAGTDDEVR